MGAFNTTKKPKSKKNDNEIRNVYASSKDGLKSCAGQDTPQMFGFEVENSTFRFMGVYDGHGEKGKEASQFVETATRKYILENKTKIKRWSTATNSKDIISKMFVEQYKKIQNIMKKEEGGAYEMSGTCCISALLIDRVCYVINLGDSRAVIGGKLVENIFAIQMSIDHKPGLAEEMERIKKAGGEVKNTQDGMVGGPMRVYKMNDANPGLAVSRSLGDCYGHECGVGEEPQVAYRILDESDHFIVMGSDGIWDVMNSVEIVGFVFEKLDAGVPREKIADEVVEECHKRWIIINKYKDNAFVERIRKDPNLSQAEKNNMENEYYKQVTEACNIGGGPSLAIPISAMLINQGQSTEERFTGKHNVDDITCVICFFKNN